MCVPGSPAPAKFNPNPQNVLRFYDIPLDTLEPISKLKNLRLDEAGAFRKARFTRSLSLRPAFEKGDNEV